MLAEIAVVVAAVLFGAAALIFIIRRQVRSAASHCSSCPYGDSPSRCAPPSDADDLPPDCDKLK